MDEAPLPVPICPQCHQPVSPDAYFCPNCGKALKEKPPETTVLTQIKIYAVSALLPPLGLIYVWKYYFLPDKKSKQIAIIALVLTIVMTVITVWITIDAVNSFNQTLNSALNGQIGG